MLESYFIRTPFRLVILFGTFSQILKLKKQKSIFGNILPVIENIKKWTPKNQKCENTSTTPKFYVDSGPKRYLGPRDPTNMEEFQS